MTTVFINHETENIKAECRGIFCFMYGDALLLLSFLNAINNINNEELEQKRGILLGVQSIVVVG